jgi:hypothetical protein
MTLVVVKMCNIRRLGLLMGLCLCGMIATAADNGAANNTSACNPATRPRPGCLPASTIQPASPLEGGARVQPSTSEQVNSEQQRLKQAHDEWAAKPHTIKLKPEDAARELEWEKNNAGINLRSNGETQKSFADGEKGSIFLDDEKYPVSSLTLNCSPQNAATLSEPIYGSRGPNLYPVWIISVQPGTCVLKNRDFTVNLVIEDPPEGDRE